MQHALMIFGLLFPMGLSAQNLNLFFNELLTEPCPYDTTVTILSPAGFTFYQTLDDTYDGPIDSSICLSLQLAADQQTPLLDLSQLDTERALFVKYDFSTAPVSLLPYRTHDFGFGYQLEGPTTVSGDSCVGNLCSGAIFSYSVPDEAGTAMLHRVDKKPYGDDGRGVCFFSEKFSDQQLNSIVMKLKFTTVVAGASLRLFTLWFYALSDFAQPVPLDTLIFPESSSEDTAYVAGLTEVATPYSGWGSYYLPQSEEYPSAEHIRYTEARPAEYTVTPVNLVLQLDENWGGLDIPPFTALRGAKVAGSDSLRHILYVEGLPGGGTCTVLDAELLGTDAGVHFRFGDDTLRFATSRACLMLKNGSSIQVKAEHKTVYGPGGIGILALQRNGWIRLHENSELIIDNRLSLVCQPYDANDQAYVDLPPGSRLIFGENARLRRTAENGVMMLNVYMNGGELDDSALSPAESRLIRRIYPEPIPVQIDSAAAPTVFPNPAADQIQIFWPRWAATSSITSDYSWFDLTGRRVAAGQVLFQRGRSELPVIQLPAGWYLLELRAAGRKRMLKIVVK